MSKVPFKPLELALREIEFEDKKTDKKLEAPPEFSDAELEFAMREFETADSPRAKARAFKAALRLARAKERN